METLAYLNGRISPAREASVSIMDRGFLFGDGVYEAGRSYDRCFLFLEEHWDRLRASAAKLELAVPWSDEELTRGLFEVAAASGEDNVCFRTIVTRGLVESVGLHLLESGPQTIAHIIQPVPAKVGDQRRNGVKVLTSRIVRNPVSAQDPNIKTSNYLNSLLACQDVMKRGSSEGILCDLDGNVTEGTNFSVFGITAAGELITPGLDVGILDSITRRHVLDLAKGKIPVREGRFGLAEFQECREVFIVSSTREIVPVAQWDERRYPVDGQLTRMLLALLQDEIQRYIGSHPRY